jgi:hypothetical protein
MSDDEALNRAAEALRIAEGWAAVHRARALESAVTEIRQIHQRGIWTASMTYYCKHCRPITKEWPCPTVKALNAWLRTTGGGD